MRVPLDFYRILSVPHQAAAGQLQQAYRDRMQQLPQYHYSDEAVSARRELIETAYTVLSNPKQRQDYDTNFLTNIYAADTAPDLWAETPVAQAAEAEVSGIDIQDRQLAGALSLLQELGEYELVLKLGSPYLSGGILELKHSRLGSILSEADIVLSVALAHLELGREQWQQNQYEKAAQSLNEGLNLLLREGLFSDVQSEIRSDLYKLRPYRILELLALPESQFERSEGLSLLKDMLSERKGVDGVGSDQSGLGVDDFLQFIQQLRHYLTIAEQRELFEAEARRPSAVAIYLSVYTLLVQGFTQRQPALIRRARAMLSRLSNHQDVYLEQAACALLLGQTEEANQALELSQEYELITFIRDYSEDSPDLIPGLYLYTERWLQDEVFPYFRDLHDQKVDLNAYFADPHVQAYLEELAAGTLYSSTTQDGLRDSDEVTLQPSRGNQSWNEAMPTGISPGSQPSGEVTPRQATPEMVPTSSPQSFVDRQPSQARLNAEQWLSDHPWDPPPQPIGASSNSNSKAGQPRSSFVRNSSSLHDLDVATPPPTPNQGKDRKRKLRWPVGWMGHKSPEQSQAPPRHQTPNQPPRVQEPPSFVGAYPGQSATSAAAPVQSTSTTPQRPKSRRPPSRRRYNTQLIGLIVLALLIGGTLAAVAGTLLFRRFQPADLSPGTQDEPLVQLEQPPLPIPAPGSQPPQAETSGIQVAASAPLTEETVRQLIQAWQLAKAEALGPKHASDQLRQVLAEPALSQWRARSEAGKATDQYWQYKLNRLNVDELELMGSNRAKAKATINETAAQYNQGQPRQGASYADTYQVQYDIVRQDGRWLIRAMGVL